MLQKFKDLESEVFSIQTLVKLSSVIFGLAPGKQLNVSMSMALVKKILSIAYSGVYKELQPLQMIIFRENTIYLDRILTKMTGLSNKCKCNKES